MEPLEELGPLKAVSVSLRRPSAELRGSAGAPRLQHSCNGDSSQGHNGACTIVAGMRGDTDSTDVEKAASASFRSGSAAEPPAGTLAGAPYGSEAQGEWGAPNSAAVGMAAAVDGGGSPLRQARRRQLAALVAEEETQARVVLVWGLNRTGQSPRLHRP